MKKLKIDIKRIETKSTSKWSSYTMFSILIVCGLVVMPILVALWVIKLVYNFVISKENTENEGLWNSIVTGTDLELKYKYARVDDLPDFVYEYFDAEPSILFDSEPNLEFFKGYFTDFRVVQNDGIFIQKVILNKENDEIISLPLYFFNYELREMTLVKDLKGYDIDTIGSPDDFIIRAIGEGGELEIKVTKE